MMQFSTAQHSTEKYSSGARGSGGSISHIVVLRPSTYGYKSSSAAKERKRQVEGHMLLTR